MERFARALLSSRPAELSIARSSRSDGQSSQRSRLYESDPHAPHGSGIRISGGIRDSLQSRHVTDIACAQSLGPVHNSSRRKNARARNRNPGRSGHAGPRLPGRRHPPARPASGEQPRRSRHPYGRSGQRRHSHRLLVRASNKAPRPAQALGAFRRRHDAKSP